MSKKNVKPPKAMHVISFFGAVRQIGGLTAVSRVLGFFRDIILAATIGSGPIADAFFVAFKIPNFFRRITAEGAVTNVFLPAYAQVKEHEGDKAAADFASEVQCTLLWGVIALTLIMELTMPIVIFILAPGFEYGGTRFNNAVLLAHITMPFLPMISLVAFWSALTNAHDRFLGGALAPIVLNVVLIIGALAGGILSILNAVPVAIAIPVAGFFQILLMQRMLKAIGKRPRWGFWPSISTAGKKMWKKFTAACLGAGSTNLNVLIDTILASTMQAGAISALYYADRIAQLPVGIIGVALGTALLPRLSNLEATGDCPEKYHVMAQGIQLGLFFALPAMLGAIILAEIIITGIFAYGAFDDNMITPIAQVLIAYAIGIPAFVLTKIFQPVFYSEGDTKTPFRISLIVVAINVAASLILLNFIGLVGLALATSFAAWCSAIIMAFLLAKKHYLKRDIFWRLRKIFFISTVMGIILYLCRPFFFDAMINSNVYAHAFILIVLIGIGLGSYFGMAMLLKTMPRNML